MDIFYINYHHVFSICSWFLYYVLIFVLGDIYFNLNFLYLPILIYYLNYHMSLLNYQYQIYPPPHILHLHKPQDTYKQLVIYIQIFIKFYSTLFMTLKLLLKKWDNRGLASTKLFICPILKSKFNPILLHHIFHT